MTIEALETGEGALELLNGRRVATMLVSLGTADLDSLREGDLLNVIDELRWFLGIEGENTAEELLRKARDHRRVLRPVLEVARQMVETLADHGQMDIRYSGGFSRLDAKGERPAVIGYPRSLRDGFVFNALLALQAEPVRRIRRCPECHQIFCAERENKIYCGHPCANLVAARAYRKKNANVRAKKRMEDYDKRLPPGGKRRPRNKG